MSHLTAFLAPELRPFHVALWFILGSALGSFFNVCIYRLPLGLSVNRPTRSFCFSCGSMIHWRDNIPLVSYWVLGGRCRDCGAPFSARYFWVELLTATLFATDFALYGYSYAFAIYLVFTSILIIATFTDLDHWIIPDSMSLGGTMAGIALAALAPLVSKRMPEIAVARVGPASAEAWWGPGCNAVAGAVFGFVLLWIVGFLGRLAFRKEAMGMGDLKLFACIGAFLGWINCALVLVLASFIGTAIGLPMLLSERKAKRRRSQDSESSVLGASSGSSQSIESCAPSAPGAQHHLPFGPSIAIAACAVMLFQRQLTESLARFTSDFVLVFQDLFR